MAYFAETAHSTCAARCLLHFARRDGGSQKLGKAIHSIHDKKGTCKAMHGAVYRLPGRTRSSILLYVSCRASASSPPVVLPP